MNPFATFLQTLKAKPELPYPAELIKKHAVHGQTERACLFDRRRRRKSTEAEWRNREDEGNTMLIQGILFEGTASERSLAFLKLDGFLSTGA
jgi:hypothetical protein